MTKNQQIAMNEYVFSNLQALRNEVLSENFPEFSIRLRSCQAYVAETENYFVLRSYQTIVAFIDKRTGQKFDVLRYMYCFTNTSAQHISKFFHDYGDFRVSTYTYRDI